MRTLCLILFVLFAGISTANAGCPIEVKIKNKSESLAKISKKETKVRVFAAGAVTAAPWKNFLEKPIKLEPGEEIVRAVNLELPCAAGPRKFKFHVKQGQNTYWENKTLATPLDRKLTLRIK